jgi:putative ABC transport system permease protein
MNVSVGRPASRAVVRWSLRLFRREWRQQLLVLALLTIAVAAAVMFATVAANSSSSVKEPFGGANTRITIDGHDPQLADRAVSEARSRFGPIDVTAHRSLAVPGAVEQLDVRDQDPNGLYSATLLDLRAGRYPEEAGEVALTDDAADLLGADLHERVTIDGQQAIVVGLVENPADLRDDFVLVAPGTLAAADQITVLADTTTDRGPADGGMGFRMEVIGSDVDQAEVAVAVLAVTTLALALVGLVAAAAFVVVAQRRQHQLGMLVAIGATDRQVRLVMLATGAITGAVAAAVGTAVGVAGWILAAPAVEEAANYRIPRTQLPWSLIAAVALLAVVVATVAAWWPARVTSRLPVMAALAGRPPAPRPVQRPLFVAVALLAGGLTAIAIADPLSRHVQHALFVGGLVAVVIGTVFATPAAIRLGGRLAARLPFAPRVALRDLARYQARAAAALGAITLGLATSIGIVAVAAAEKPDPDAGDLSDSELVVHVPGAVESPPSPDLTAAEIASLDRRAATVIAALGEDVASAPLDVAMSSRPTPDATPRQPIELGVSSGPHSFEGRGVPFVATPEMLDLYGIDPQSVEPGVELLTSRREPFRFMDITAGERDRVARAETQHVDLPTYKSAPNALVTEAAMAEHGWVPARVGWIVESPSPLTRAQVQAAREAAADLGLAVEARSTHDELAALRNGATLVGGALAVAIVAIAVGLIRSEARRDVRTLTATGASGRTRRALTATTAAGLALPGVVLGLTGAYLALVASYHADLGRLVPVPVGQLVPLAIGTPLAAAAVGWLLAGREPRSFARQELE